MKKPRWPWLVVKISALKSWLVDIGAPSFVILVNVLNLNLARKKSSCIVPVNDANWNLRATRLKAKNCHVTMNANN